MFLRHHDRQFKPGAKHRLVPAGKHPARIGGLHLRGQHHLLARARSVFHIKQSLRLRRDAPVEFQRERIFARTDFLG